MPQTREHLDICRLLGVRAGLVALTKVDLLGELGPEWVELVRADLAALAADTFLEGAPVVPVSVRTGEGLEALKAHLFRLTREVPHRPAEGPALLPVDRTFSLRGFGTVVTGTLLSGSLQAEDAVSLLPGSPGPFRVRGLQVHGASVAQASAGSRVAVNLSGVEADAVSRGQVLVRHGEVPQTRMLDVEVSVLPAADRALPRRSRWLMHLGTCQVDATLALLDLPGLEPGETGLAQLRLAEPVAALPGQRFILRGSRVLPGRGATVAGGRVLSTTPPKRRRGSAEAVAALVDADLDTRLLWHLRQAGYAGLTEADLFGRMAVGHKPLTRALELAGTRGHALLVDKERRLYLSADVFAGMKARALALLEDFHRREPLAEGMGREELRQRLSSALEPRLLQKLVSALVDEGKVEGAGEALRLKGRGRAMTLDEAGARARMVTALAAAALAPPTVNELARTVALPPTRVHELLATAVVEGLVVRVSEELYFDARALAELRSRLVAHLQEHKDITTQGFKELVAQTRKFVIPLSEYFDREKVTLRVGEKRILRRA